MLPPFVVNVVVAVVLVMCVLARRVIPALSAWLRKLLFKTKGPASTVIGPLILTELFRVTVAALVVLPIVNPVTPESIVKVDGKVCAEPKLALLSNEYIPTVPVVLIAVVPRLMLSPLSVTTLLEVVTLVAALKPSVTEPMLMPKFALSLVPTMLMAPDLAKMLPLKLVATSVVAVPELPVKLMPPPVPVASMVPLKLIPKLAEPPVTPEASPTNEMACAVVLADRKTMPPGP